MTIPTKRFAVAALAVFGLFIVAACDGTETAEGQPAQVASMSVSAPAATTVAPAPATAPANPPDATQAPPTQAPPTQAATTKAATTKAATTKAGTTKATTQAATTQAPAAATTTRPAAPATTSAPRTTTAAPRSTTAPVPVTEATEESGSCVIKGNISNKGEKIYHVPGGQSYEATKIDTAKGERWFCTEAAAVAAGWRKALR